MREAWQASSIIAGLLVLLTYCFTQSRGPDLTLRARIQERLQAFELHDAELTRDVLLARAGLLPSYDSLARTGRDSSSDLETLHRESAAGSREAAAALAKPIEALALAVQQKLTLIEYFKSDNALLRNSLIFFCRTGQARELQADRPGTSSAEIGVLSSAMLSVILAPELKLAQDIQPLLERLSELPASDHEFQELLVHGGFIAQVLPQVDRQLREIIAAPTAARTQAVQDAVLRYSLRVEERAQLFRLLLYLVALILLAYLIHQFVRLRLGAAELRRTNEELNRKIAERERLQEANRQQELQLIQANKMTALGILVSGVAHEINNPNQLVLVNSRVLSKVWDDTVRILDALYCANGDFTLGGLAYAEMRETVAALIRDIHAGTLRIGRIVDDLKNFARPRARGGAAALQLNDAVQHAQRLLAHLVTQRTSKLHTRLAPNLPPVAGEAQQVEQIVINLLVNALEALPDRDRAVSVSTAFDWGERIVMLEVSDEGIGIPAEHLERLCDPFFTTKQETGGTGLGLAITSSLVRAHGGSLTFHSEPGQGTRVVVEFPCIYEPIPLQAVTVA